MPTYIYGCDDDKYSDLHIEIVQSIKSDPFTSMGQLADYINDGGNIDVFQKVGDDEWEEVDGFYVNDESRDIACYIIFSPPVLIFKGTGWTTKSGDMQYTGKHKKKVEELREKRRNRVKKGISLSDVGASSSAANAKEWDRMSSEQKKTAREIGVVPAKETV